MNKIVLDDETRGNQTMEGAMNRIVINDELRMQMNGCETPQQICTSAGELIGYFVSPQKFASFMDAWEKREEADVVELERRAQEEETYTLAEIWKELGVQ